MRKAPFLAAFFLILTAPAFASPRTAENCEIFVDRVMTVLGSHAASQVTFYLKTLNDRLDGAPVRVGFFGSRRIENDPSYQPRPESIPASVFERSKDYYEVTLFISGDYTPTYWYSGFFFVETDKGTVYAARPEQGERFVLNRELKDNVAREGRSSFYHSDPRSAVVAADGFPYLNPDRCR